MGTKPNLKPYFISNSLFCLHIFSLSRDLFAVRPLSNILLVVHCHYFQSQQKYFNFQFMRKPSCTLTRHSIGSNENE